MPYKKKCHAGSGKKEGAAKKRIFYNNNFIIGDQDIWFVASLLLCTYQARKNKI
jgi:hypothetical protein